MNCSGVATPLARSCRSRSAREIFACDHFGSSIGRLRSARSQMRCCPSRPTIITSPLNQRMSSIIVTLRPRSSFQPPVCQPSAVRSSRSRARSGPRRLQLAQDVAAERSVRLQPALRVRRTGLVAAPARVAPHRGSVDREVGGGHDVDPVLEQRALVPQQAFELRHPEPSSPAARTAPDARYGRRPTWDRAAPSPGRGRPRRSRRDAATTAADPSRTAGGPGGS